MRTFIIGDVQGCYDPLMRLLDLVSYDSEVDRLGFCGDLVNRGPQSLDVLRFVMSLRDPLVVLGNHDLFLLALAYAPDLREQYNHTLDPILSAHDLEEMIAWLRKQPFFYREPDQSFCMVHAGILPQWSLAEAQSYAHELSDFLKNCDLCDWAHNMWGNKPDQWHGDLQGWDKVRFLVNVFTRMRFCNESGSLDLVEKTAVHSSPARYKPWFVWRDDLVDDVCCFGHWASLDGVTGKNGYIATDTGCVWGRSLAAYCIEEKACFMVPASRTE